MLTHDMEIAMLADGILGWLLIGLVAGILGKIIMPGRDPGGFVVTILIGIAGALLGGYLAPLLDWTPNATWERYAAATGGAVILLALYRLIMTRRVR
ncbi:GlsB/YeaQ/YmgE family stress response membrane protein [Sphingomonas sp. PB4P5]